VVSLVVFFLYMSMSSLWVCLVMSRSRKLIWLLFSCVIVSLRFLWMWSTYCCISSLEDQLCEELVDGVKRVVRKADRIIKDKRAETVSQTTSKSQNMHSQLTVIQEIKLPTIKLEQFAGNIETWSEFLEQFESSVDKNQSLSTINKHVLLRGYLEGKPKRLVDGIAVMAETYEQTNKILQARYGDKNRNIQAHLDYLEDLQPAQSDSPEALNSTYVECYRRIQTLNALRENIDT